MFDVTAVAGRSMLEITHTRRNVGKCRLWIPEAVSTERRLAMVYPYGMDWEREGDTFFQNGSEEQAFGPGNCPEVEPDVLECVGIRMRKEHPISWTTSCAFGEDRIDFSITIRNNGPYTLEKAAAAVCFSFEKAGWWSDADTFLHTTDGIRSIADLGRSAGQPNGFQVWLVEGESYDQRFYREFWGFGSVSLKEPVWVSRCESEGCSVVVGCESAYFVHSNQGNPCTDLAVKYGDLAPGTEVTRSGYIQFTDQSVDDIFETVSRKDSSL